MHATASLKIVMEACGGANYWAREFTGRGHQVKLISPQYVKPFVKSNKTDAKFEYVVKYRKAFLKKAFSWIEGIEVELHHGKE